MTALSTPLLPRHQTRCPAPGAILLALCLQAETDGMSHRGDQGR